MEKFEHELESMLGKSRRRSTQSSDDSSVKEVDVESKREVALPDGASIGPRPSQLQLVNDLSRRIMESQEDRFEIEDLLKAGTDELLKTSVLSLTHLSNDKIISLMQLIVESGHSQLDTVFDKRLSNPQISRLFTKFIARMKVFVSSRFILSSRSQLSLYKVLTMTRSRSSNRTGGVEMSEAVARVLEGSYLAELQHLALPSCDVSTIVKALVKGHVFTLQYLDLQGPSDQQQYPKSRFLRTLFRSGLLRKLHHLRLSRCMDVDDVETMAAAIESRKLSALKYLDLSFNLVPGEHGSRCLEKLMSCRALLDLEHLNLSNCGIGDVGIQALSDAMEARGPWKLRYLNIGSNEIGDVGFLALLRVFRADRLPLLQELHSLYNYGIGEESKMMGAQVLEEGHLPALQVLYMSSHSITERVAIALLAAFKNNTAVTVELPGIVWPNVSIEREAAQYRERNLGLLNCLRKDSRYSSFKQSPTR